MLGVLVTVLLEPCKPFAAIAPIPAVVSHCRLFTLITFLPSPFLLFGLSCLSEDQIGEYAKKQ